MSRSNVRCSRRLETFHRVLSGEAAAGRRPAVHKLPFLWSANDVVVDNLWAWRADHGNGVGWTQNPCNQGVIVNGDRVTIYGLFVEHHEQYQTLWNGNWGRLYFYQSELPYDPPSQAAWSHDGEDGYASYKVADAVTSHQAYGLGIYAVFINSTNISCDNAIETPANSQQVNLHDMTTVYIAGNTSGAGLNKNWKSCAPSLSCASCESVNCCIRATA